jgi:hypothetical protein
VETELRIAVWDVSGGRVARALSRPFGTLACDGADPARSAGERPGGRAFGAATQPCHPERSPRDPELAKGNKGVVEGSRA